MLLPELPDVDVAAAAATDEQGAVGVGSQGGGGHMALWFERVRYERVRG